MNNALNRCRKSLALALALAALAGGAARAQEEEQPQFAPPLERARDAFRDAIERLFVPRSRLTDGPQTRAAFREVIAQVSKSAVQIRCDGQTVALGGIVGPDGWVLTKATQLEDDPVVRLKDGREFPARVTGVNREFDLAMLKIDARRLPAVPLGSLAEAHDGDWVATVGTGRDPVAVGVLSVGAREIPHRRGLLGIQGEETDQGAMIVKVFPNTGAERAGLLINDVIISVGGEPTPQWTDVHETIGEYSPGDRIEIGVRRGGRELVLSAVLMGENSDMFGESRSDYQNKLGSELSMRRFGFPSAVQHDTALSAEECGGPLVNLDGEVIGFNVARAGRTESYAAPTEVVRTLMFDLMSGALAPDES